MKCVYSVLRQQDQGIELLLEGVGDIIIELNVMGTI